MKFLHRFECISKALPEDFAVVKNIVTQADWLAHCFNRLDRTLCILLENIYSQGI